MGLIERLALSAARITSPRLSGGPGYRRALTDPNLWQMPAPAFGPLPSPEQTFREDVVLQRWFHQVRRDQSGMQVMMRRMAGERPEFTGVYVKMRELGFRFRREAGTAINHDHGMLQTFMPYQRSNWVSDRRLIFKICELYGIEYSQMTPNEKIAAVALGDGQHAVYAYMQTFETIQAPQLVIDFEPTGPDEGDPDHYVRNRDIWTHYAACCLAKYLYDLEMYQGRGAPVEVISPFDPRRYASFIPLSHSFAKALLLRPSDCEPMWHCGCNTIEGILNQVPEDHPWQTGELPGHVVRNMAVAQGYGQAAPPSRAIPYTPTPPRGMTPPAGTYLHEWRRRQTDPNLRSPNNGNGGGRQ